MAIRGDEFYTDLNFVHAHHGAKWFQNTRVLTSNFIDKCSDLGDLEQYWDRELVGRESIKEMCDQRFDLTRFVRNPPFQNGPRDAFTHSVQCLGSVRKKERSTLSFHWSTYSQRNSKAGSEDGIDLSRELSNCRHRQSRLPATSDR